MNSLQVPQCKVIIGINIAIESCHKRTYSFESLNSFIKGVILAVSDDDIQLNQVIKFSSVYN